MATGTRNGGGRSQDALHWDERAIIDIGSNTVRLVIYGGPPRAPIVLLNEKVTARLGKGVAENGKLSAKGMATALAALARFALLLKLRGVKHIDVAATAAARDASNGQEFLEAVRQLGLHPCLLSGEEEAETSAMGVIGAIPGAKGVVADLGGGSLELIHIEGGSSRHGASLPFGTLRLPALRQYGPARFARRIRKGMTAVDWHCAEGECLYLVGGSLRAFARVAMDMVKWPIDDPHGFELSPELALQACRKITSGKLPALIPGLSSSRRPSLPDAAALLAVLIREGKPARLVFSSWGLREGLVFKSLPPELRRQDPLVASTGAFAKAMGCGMEVAVRVVSWTGRVAPSSREGLRLAVTALAMASFRIEPNLRAEELMEWALRKRWVGVDAAGRGMMAACALANSGRPLPTDILGVIATPEQLREAVSWGLATRLCRRFCAGEESAIANSTLTVGKTHLVLHVRSAYTPLLSDSTHKDLRALADHLGLQPDVKIVLPTEPLPAADR